MTTEQTELMQKLNCLQVETSRLSHAYQLWRSDVEQGTAPEWMAAAIRITYDALMTPCSDPGSVLALDPSHAGESERYALSGPNALPLKRAWPAEGSVTALCLRHSQPLPYGDAETASPVRLMAPVEGSLALSPVTQQNRILGVLTLANVPHASSTNHLAQLEAAACEISGILGEGSATAESYPELLPIADPDWSATEMPVAIAPPSTRNAILEPPVIQEGQRTNGAEAEAAEIHHLATVRLPDWLQGASSPRLFGATSVAILVTVALLMTAGGALGIYVASPKRVAAKSDLRLAAKGAAAIPTGEKAGFKFDPDPVVAPPGSSFVLNAVLSRGSDIASVAAEIDYDANLLEFMGVSEGGFLLENGRQFALAKRDDPATGVLKISAEQSPGQPGVSGDGAVFALSFQARKKGTATVSIVPSAHDSQGRRIEMAGSQVSVSVNAIAKTAKTSQGVSQ